MKLRLYFRPGWVVLLLAFVAAILWWVASASPLSLLALPLALFYSALLLIAGWASWRARALEQSAEWREPGRLLILAPHEDDCVITAGGIGAINRRLGGATRIVYLAPDENPGMAAIRASEARAAWREARVDAGDLQFLDLLPPLLRRDPARLRTAATTLRAIIDEFKPTAIVTPMFEGGHVHHDMVAALLETIVRADDAFDIFEAPEYGPYVSLNNTPHRVVALCARWLLGVVSYYGPADGVDGRPLRTFRLSQDDLERKRRMLAAFSSQNAPSLMATRCYPDRLVPWDRARRRRQPFDYRHSYLRAVQALDRLVGARLGNRLLPGQRGTIGRAGHLTDWRQEWNG